MISRQELQYVGDYARRVPYPGDDYARDVINQLAHSVDIFKKKYDGKKYNIILSNGEEISFEIKNKNIAHLLGIDYKQLTTSEYMQPLVETILGIDFTQPTSSYTILNRIIENGDEVIRNDRSNYNKFLNYYRLMVKTSCFDKLSDFNDFNFGFIDFNKMFYEEVTGVSYLPSSTKYIFCHNDEALIPYCMMGLKPDNDLVTMIPETLIAPMNFSDYLVNQELLLPIQMLINDEENLTKLVATSEEKIRLLNLYKYLIQTHNTNSYINIYNDYETMLRDDVTKSKKYVK